MAWLLDSCVAIDLRDGRGGTIARIGALSTRPAISTVTLVELEGGVYANLTIAELRRRALDSVLRKLEIIDFTSAMAETYGRIVQHHGYSRRKIIDRMIAATALVHDLTLITNNGADFADIDGLNLLVWEA